MFQQQQWILYNRRERKNIFSRRRERRWMFGAQNAFTMPLNCSLFSPLLLPRYSPASSFPTAAVSVQSSCESEICADSEYGPAVKFAPEYFLKSFKDLENSKII